MKTFLPVLAGAATVDLVDHRQSAGLRGGVDRRAVATQTAVR
jgi:hypothetical protein